MTATAPEVKSVAAQLEQDRWAATQERHTAIMNAPGKDLADLTDTEFEDGLRRLRIVQDRMKKIIDTVLIKDVHYGRERDRNGNDVFKKDRLKRAGAEELRRFMRFTVKDIAPPDVTATEEIVSVTVTCGLFDSYGRQLATWSSNCNTKEKRFRKYDGKGWTYTDPREAMHDCISMARKRCSSHLTEEASGATGFFADGDDMHAALEDDEKPMSPWTADEKRIVGEAAAAKGMGRNAFAKLVEDTLGRPKVGTGEDVKLMLAAIARWEKSAKPAPTQARAAADAADAVDADERQRAEDEALDLRLAEEE
jgi:hypothetical protein